MNPNKTHKLNINLSTVSTAFRIKYKEHWKKKNGYPTEQL